MVPKYYIFCCYGKYNYSLYFFWKLCCQCTERKLAFVLILSPTTSLGSFTSSKIFKKLIIYIYSLYTRVGYFGSGCVDLLLSFLFFSICALFCVSPIWIFYCGSVV
jgi:hypothetical protein